MWKKKYILQVQLEPVKNLTKICFLLVQWSCRLDKNIYIE